MELTILPASDGDCILISAGDGAGRATHILIDGGRSSTYSGLAAQLAGLPEEERELALLVVTHIDADHIAGILKMARAAKPAARVSEVWFNAYAHLERLVREAGPDGTDAFGPGQGDKLSDAIAARGWSWNARFDGRAVTVGMAGSTARREVGPFALTLLGPHDAKLKALERQWRIWSAAAGLARGMPDPPDVVEDGVEAFGPRPAPNVEALSHVADGRDTAIANGSSIAFLVEADGKTALMAADAHPDDLETAVATLIEPGSDRLRVDLTKVSHHGSRENTTHRLLSLLDCTRFAFSTDGSKHGHPHPETIARILKSTARHKTLYFNYRQPQTEIWDDPELCRAYAYDVVFGVDGGLRLDV